MTIIKGITKKGKQMIESARHYKGYELRDVYSRYSDVKREAWELCHDKMRKENGTGFHISSHNTFGFTVVWEVENGVRIETRDNSYLVLFPEYCN